MREEIWKDIPGFEGQDQASTFGRIRSVERELVVANPSGRKSYSRTHKSCVLKGYKDKNGYNYTFIYEESVKVKCLTQRLVAITFIDNPNGCRYVSFKDGDRDNMDVTNLEWSNRRYRRSNVVRS